MNTRLLVTGGAVALTVALVAGQTGAPPPQPSRAAAPAAAPQAPPRTAPVPARAAAPAAAAAPASNVAGQRALVDQYCVTCHNARLKTAGLMLDELDLAQLGDHPEIAEKVVRKMRAGLMPPTDARRPDPATLESMIRWMEGELDRHAGTHLPAPGLHRMNRAEYTNAISDKMA